MASKKTLVDIVRKLLQHLEVSDGLTYRDEVVAKIIHMCSQEHYQFVTNFEWYIQVLVQLTRVESTRHGKLLANQLMDVAIRVKVIRPFATKQMAGLLTDQRLFSGANTVNGVCEVLYAAAWVVGEVGDVLEEPLPVMEALLQPRISSLPPHIQAVYVHNTVKFYGAMVRCKVDEEVLTQLLDMMAKRLPLFVQSGDLEVQVRWRGS